MKRFYDGATNGKGRFWYHYTGGDFSTGNNVEHTAIDSYDALGRPLVQRQLFKLNGAWSSTYQISRAYNRAGGVTSQTYPSGHSVTYNCSIVGVTARLACLCCPQPSAFDSRHHRFVAGSQEEWQIYGFEGELLAEYRASAPPSSPEKEYGYRNGQLLITATGRLNVALTGPSPAVLYDPKTNPFVGASKTLNKQLMNDAQIQEAIQKGMKYWERVSELKLRMRLLLKHEWPVHDCRPADGIRSTRVYRKTGIVMLIHTTIRSGSVTRSKKIFLAQRR